MKSNQSPQSRGNDGVKNPKGVYRGTSPSYKPKTLADTSNSKTEHEYEDFKPCRCPYCGLDLDEHDGDGFCPPGTEEFGGRR